MAYDCGQCIAATGAKLGFPTLDPANAQAWELYQTLAGQQRVGWDVLGLDLTVLPIVFDTYDIPHDERRLLLEKLLLIDGAMGRERQRKREIQQAHKGPTGGARRVDV